MDQFQNSPNVVGTFLRKIWQGKKLAKFTGKTMFSRSKHNEVLDVANSFLNPSVNPPSAADIKICETGWILDLSRVANQVTASGMNFLDQYSNLVNYSPGNFVWVSESTTAPRVPYVCLVANGPGVGAGVQSPIYPEPGGTVYWRNVARFFFDLTTVGIFNPGRADGQFYNVGQAATGDVYFAGQVWRANATDHSGTTRNFLRHGLLVTTAAMNPREPHWFTEYTAGGSDPNANFPGEVILLGFTSAGKPMIAGTFDHVNRVVCGSNGINGGAARLNIDGSVDTGFNPGSGLTTGADITGGLVDSGDNIILTGSGTHWNGGSITNNGAIRITSGGAYDASFAPSLGGGVFAVGAPIIPQSTTSYFCSCPAEGIRKMAQSNGATDGTFSTGTGITGGANNIATALCLSSNLYAGIDGNTYNGTSVGNLIRVNASTGALDGTFLPAFAASGFGSVLISAIAVQASGKILVGGQFNTVNGTTRNALCRLNTNGTLDTSFTAQPGGTTNPIYSILILADGSIVVTFAGNSFNGSTRYGIAWLDANGNLQGV